MTTKPIGPYASPMFGSVIEAATILGQLLRSEGYSRDVIMDLSIGEFLAHERATIVTPSNMHLLALKKALLYVIPVISPPGVHQGITLTSQVSCPAIQYNTKKNESVACALAVGDKYRLIGIALRSSWTNHLANDVFPWKQYQMQQVHFNYSSISFNLGALDGLQAISSTAYLIESSHYEDKALFNRINKILVMCLDHPYAEASSIMASLSVLHPLERLPIVKRMTPFNDQAYIPRLNSVLPCLITPIYTMSEYECLQMSSNWRLYDEIKLFGIEAPSVKNLLSNLQYMKEETLRAQTNLKALRYQSLLRTRGEKLARERYPHYFDYTDRRALFIRFNRFSMSKLPEKERKELGILVDKEIQAQNALLKNQCEHIAVVQHLTTMHRSGSDEATIEAFRRLEPYINPGDTMCLCKLCSYPLLCQHEIEFYTALQSVDFSSEAVDKAYLVRQRIINKFKQTNHQRVGTEDTEVGFTFYCRLCGGDLGKSNDIVQAGIRTRDQSGAMEETSPVDSSIFSGIAHIVKHNMNQSAVPTTHRSVNRLIFSEAKDLIVGHIDRANKLEKEYLELFIRYIAYVYACASLIAIKVKLGLTSNILVHRDTTRSGGAATDIKADFVTAYKIIQSNLAFKRVGVTEAKAKALLIHAFKSINRAFGNAVLPLKASSAVDRLRNDILTSPITKYAVSMYRRHYGEREIVPLTVVGVDLAQWTQKAKREASKSSRLFANIFVPPAASGKAARAPRAATGVSINARSTPGGDSEFDQYVQESYQSLVHTVAEAPLSFTPTAPLSEFVVSFQGERTLYFRKLRSTPRLNLPSENGREFDFRLVNLHIGYCLDPTRPHRWDISKSKTDYHLICTICKLEKAKVPTDAPSVRANNKKIQDNLDNRMLFDAFFELYTLSCPEKDVHEYANGACSLCGVRKEQLAAKDASYYEKYARTYLEFRARVTKQLLQSAHDIINARNADYVEETCDELCTVDCTKLESLGTSLSKLFGHSNMNTLGKNAAGERVFEIVESYVRLLYSHYTFARNLSVDTTGHPDMEFFNMTRALSLSSLAPLPEYPKSRTADALLADLFQILYDAASVGNPDMTKLLQFLVNKMLEQESKHQMYNVGRLRTSAFVEEADDDDDSGEPEEPEGDEAEQLEGLFQGYDIGADDQEDNMNGEYE